MSRFVLSMRERIFFTKRLSLYLRSGIPMLEALDLFSDDVSSRPGARVLESVTKDVQDGTTLSIALSRFPRAYPISHVQLIAVGETSGTLPDSLSRLSRLLSRRAELHRMILAALAYPAAILAGTLGVIGLLMLYVFPKVIPLLVGLHVPLPFATRMLLRVQQVTLAQVLLLCGASFVVAFAARFSVRRRRIRMAMDRFILSLPLIGTLVQGYILTSLFYSLHVLLASGARLDSALSLARTGVRNQVYRDSLSALESAIAGGQRLSVSMQGFPSLYPPAASQMIAAGEMTGTLSESAEAVALFFEESVAERAKVLSTLLEPLLMLCMGLAVGFVAFAIITPMYAVTQHISS